MTSNGMTSIRVIPLLLAALTATTYAEVYSCGGFVRSPVPIDFSKIKVKLLTPEGHLRHEEVVNSANGYYMIPVYTKGSYSIRVSAPEGWFFEPSSFDFKLDGETDRCTLEEDIMFDLSAFAIEGSVESQTGQGPSGLELQLLQDGKAIASTTTTEGGNYRFQAPPGKYTVSTKKDSSVCISHSSSHVEIKSGPIKVEPSLRISGYPLTVKVATPGGALSDIELSLYSSTDVKLDNCRAVGANDKKVAGATRVCSLGKTNAQGEVRVPCLAPGSYHIVPHSEGLSFEPSVGAVSVKDGSATTSFTVSGFTANGRVLVGGKAVANVEVLLDGKVLTSTDASGLYALPSLRDGLYSLTARAPHIKFATHDNVPLSIATRAIPNITVEGFEVCGKVEKGSDGTYEKLSLTSKDKSGNIQSIRPDASGEFCKLVPPGTYTLGPLSSESSLSPQSMPIDLRSSPEIGVIFTHFKTDLEVKVTCLAACETQQLTLISSRGVKTHARGSDHFLFKDVSPGKYTVKVAEGGRYCWKKDEMNVVVEQTRPIPVSFEQSGVNAFVVLSHPAKIDWEHAEEAVVKGVTNGKKGLNTICLPTAGTYKMKLSSCMAFDKPTLTLTVPSDARIEAYAVSASVDGKIAGVVAPGTKVEIKSEGGVREVTVDASGAFSFQEPLTSNGQSISVRPISTTHLFAPLSHTFIFDGECIKNVVSFESAKGIFIDGTVSPPVADVEITAVHKKDANVVIKTKTNAAGSYRIGPVRVAEDLAITAHKDGYAFTAGKRHGDMTSVKLSQLTLTFEDKATGQRLNEVMLYVRGGAGEKKNAHHTVEKDGQIKLAALAPGTFIRAVLQEYEFDPSTITVAMKEGEHDEKIIKGTRVAYSAYGLVREMGGNPVSGVTVEALSEQCDQHQIVTTTVADGSFRVRALKPGCSYRIALRGQDGIAPPHCFPSSFSVKMTAEDVKGLEMVAAPMDEGVELLVDVDVLGPANVQRPSLKVTVLREGRDTVAVQTLPSPVSLYALRNLSRDGRSYTVRVETINPPSSTGATALHYAPAEVDFVADRAVRVVHVQVTPSRSAHEVDISKSSIVAVVLFAALAIFIVNPQEWIDKAKTLSSRLQGGYRQSSPSPMSTFAGAAIASKKRR